MVIKLGTAPPKSTAMSGAAALSESIESIENATNTDLADSISQVSILPRIPP